MKELTLLLCLSPACRGFVSAVSQGLVAAGLCMVLRGPSHCNSIPMEFFNDIATGAVSQGTNLATFIALNVVLLLVIFSLILLLAFSLTANPALVPHVLVLIFLAIGLWGLMIWLIGVVGVVKSTAAATVAAPTEATPAEGDSKKVS